MGFPVSLDRFGKLSVIPVGNPQFVEKQAAIVFLVSFVGLKEGNDLIGLAALIQEGSLFGQTVEEGEFIFPGFLSCGFQGGKADTQNQDKRQDRMKKRGEGPLPFPCGYSSHSKMGMNNLQPRMSWGIDFSRSSGLKSIIERP